VSAATRERWQAARDAGTSRAGAFPREYLAAAGIRDESNTPSSASGKTGTLTNSPMNGIDAYRMIRRRTAEACFRVTLDEVEQIKI